MFIASRVDASGAGCDASPLLAVPSAEAPSLFATASPLDPPSPVPGELAPSSPGAGERERPEHRGDDDHDHRDRGWVEAVQPVRGHAGEAVVEPDSPHRHRGTENTEVAEKEWVRIWDSGNPFTSGLCALCVKNYLTQRRRGTEKKK